MHLLIFDPHDRGHYLTYVRYLLEASAVAPRTTLVLRKDAERLDSFEQQVRHHLGGAKLDLAIDPESYRIGPRLLEDFSRALHRNRPDHVWVPSGDLLARHLGLARLTRPWRAKIPCEVEVGLIEARFHRPPKRARGHLRFWFDRLMLAVGPWSRIHTIDPTLAAWAAERRGPMRSRISALPDPIDPFERIPMPEARRLLGLPGDGRLVAAVGSHAMPRKGSQLLLEAFAQADLPPTDRLLLAGPLGAELAGRLRTEFAPLVHAGRVLTIDRYLGDTELMHSLAAADLVCTPYFDHPGSSAIVLKAAQAGRPVLAPAFGWTGDIVPQLQLGVAGDILNVSALASRLGPALDDAGDFRPSASANRLADYSLSRNFGARWSARLRERLGLPVAAGERTWSWVVEGTAPTR